MAASAYIGVLDYILYSHSDESVCEPVWPSCKALGW